MAFSHKDWKDSPDTTTPLSAAALENMEDRLAAYTDQEVATRAASSHTHAVGQLGSGTPSAGKYLDGGGSWTTLPSAGSGSIARTDAGGNLGAAYTWNVPTTAPWAVLRNVVVNATGTITLSGLQAGVAQRLFIIGAKDASGTSRTLSIDDGTGAAAAITLTTTGQAFELAYDWDGSVGRVYNPGGQGIQGPQGVQGATGATGAQGPAGPINRVQEEGSDLPQRSKINFIGASVTAADDSGNDRTNVTISGGGGSSAAGAYDASWNGLLTANFDPTRANSNASLFTSGGVSFARLFAPSAITIANIWCIVNTAGVTLAGTGAVVYSAAGVLLGRTASQDTSWDSTGVKTMAVTAESGQSLAIAAGGSFIVGFIATTGGTAPQLARETNGNHNLNLTGLALRYAFHSGTGFSRASPPASLSAGVMNGSGTNTIWAGVS